MKQEGAGSFIPSEYDGNFDGFDAITRSSVETTDPFTSTAKEHVDIPDDYAGQPELKIYHSHTNDTPFSGKDYEWMTRKNVEKVSVIAANGDVYSVSIGSGYRPTIEEYKEVLGDKIAEANIAIMDYPEYYSWTPEQKTFMAIREQAYMVARCFGWTLEGGRL